jgi:hypothetical protein
MLKYCNTATGKKHGTATHCIIILSITYDKIYEKGNENQVQTFLWIVTAIKRVQCFSEDSFYEKVELAFDKFLKYRRKQLLYINARVG